MRGERFQGTQPQRRRLVFATEAGRIDDMHEEEMRTNTKCIARHTMVGLRDERETKDRMVMDESRKLTHT